jgi:hypothetical protein
VSVHIFWHCSTLLTCADEVLISTTSLVLQLLCGVKNVNCGSVALMVPSVKINKSTKVIDRAEDRKGHRCDVELSIGLMVLEKVGIGELSASVFFWIV